MTTRLQQRRDTAANWTSNNPTLAAGEFGFETDTKKFKVGDGTTAWTSLTYASSTGTVSSIVAGTGLTGGTITTSGTVAIDTTVTVDRTTAQTLTNKTLTAPAIDNPRIGYTTTVTSSTPVVLTSSSNYQQFFTGSTAQTLTLPVVTTLTLGTSFYVNNNSSASMTINSSGGNLVLTLPANMTATITCILITGTTAASWDADFSGATNITGTGSLVFGTSPTLTTPTISSIVNSGTLTLPTSTDTLVGKATTDTLTNKTISAGTLTSTLTAGGSTGTPGYVLSTTGSGVQWVSSDPLAVSYIYCGNPWSGVGDVVYDAGTGGAYTTTWTYSLDAGTSVSTF
jgi:hypothetical protein